jgi:hypothetical protein
MGKSRTWVGFMRFEKEKNKTINEIGVFIFMFEIFC